MNRLVLLVALVAACGGGNSANTKALPDTTAFADSVTDCEAALAAVTESSLDTAVSTQAQARCAAILSRSAIKKYYPGAR